MFLTTEHFELGLQLRVRFGLLFAKIPRNLLGIFDHDGRGEHAILQRDGFLVLDELCNLAHPMSIRAHPAAMISTLG